MKVLLLFSFLFFVISCHKNENKNSEKVISEKHKNIFNVNDDVLKKNIEDAILKNDTVAYKRYYKDYVINGHSRDFLYYALLMAEKNNFKKAYVHVSSILDFPLDNPLLYQSKFAAYNLLKAYEMGDEGAIESVKYMYTEKGKKIPHSTSVFCK